VSRSPLPDETLIEEVRFSNLSVLRFHPNVSTFVSLPRLGFLRRTGSSTGASTAAPHQKALVRLQVKPLRFFGRQPSDGAAAFKVDEDSRAAASDVEGERRVEAFEAAGEAADSEAALRRSEEGWAVSLPRMGQLVSTVHLGKVRKK